MSYIEEGKKDLVKDVQRFDRLGVRLENSPNDCFVVYHNSKSSLVVEVKSNKHLDPLLMYFKKLVLRKCN